VLIIATVLKGNLANLVYIKMGRLTARKKRGFIGVKAWQKRRNEAGLSDFASGIQEQSPRPTVQHALQTPKSTGRQLNNIRNMSEEKLLNSDFGKSEGKRTCTRTRAKALGKNSRILKEEVATGYKLQDFSLLNECLKKSSICSSCKSAKSNLEIFQENTGRNGLAESLFIFCSNCRSKTQFSTSKKMLGRPGCFEVNRRSVLASQSRQKLANFCTTMNLPPPILSKPYSAHLKEMHLCYLTEAHNKMKDAAKRLLIKTEHEEPHKVIENENGNRIAEVSVTVDGTWQKRGHKSKHGVVFILSVQTGEILDFEVFSHYCHACVAHEEMDKDSIQYKAWAASHTKECQINHHGSSGEMETEGAIRMFSRSVQSRNLKYTQFVGDGDSSCYGSVSRAMKELYGDSYQVIKEECVGHVQKRMGAALEGYKKGMKGRKLSDGKGAGGMGRLTGDMIKRVQNYYGSAIRNNKGNLDAMKTAVLAIKCHLIREDGVTLQFQHRFCPKNKETWCKFWKDQLYGTSEYDESGRLPSVFMAELEPIFKRLSDNELLNRCLLGLTQNQNECINGLLWSRVPKSAFCGKRRIEIAVCETVCVANTGAASKGLLMEKLGISPGYNMLKGLRIEDSRRLQGAARKVSQEYRAKRKQLRLSRNVSKKIKQLAYKAGSFGLSCRPEHEPKKGRTMVQKRIDGTQMVAERKRLRKETDMEISFISDDDVPLVAVAKKRRRRLKL